MNLNFLPYFIKKQKNRKQKTNKQTKKQTKQNKKKTVSKYFYILESCAFSSHLISSDWVRKWHHMAHITLTWPYGYAPSHNYFDELSLCSEKSLIFDLKISIQGLLTTWIGNWFQSLMVVGKNESLHAAMFHLWVLEFQIIPSGTSGWPHSVAIKVDVYQPMNHLIEHWDPGDFSTSFQWLPVKLPYQSGDSSGFSALLFFTKTGCLSLNSVAFTMGIPYGRGIFKQRSYNSLHRRWPWHPGYNLQGSSWSLPLPSEPSWR